MTPPVCPHYVPVRKPADIFGAFCMTLVVLVIIIVAVAGPR